MLVKMPLHQSYVEGGGGRRDGEEGGKVGEIVRGRKGRCEE